MEFMEALLIIAGCFASFGLGVVTHKYVVSEAQSVKDHISAEIAAWRVDVAKLLTRI